MTCAHCGDDRHPSNLVLVNGQRLCPEALYAIAAQQIAHQMPATPVPSPLFPVEDLPRGNAGRLAALARRRSA